MLKQRVLTGLVLITVFLWAVFAWPAQGFVALVVAVCTLGAHEWSALGGMQKPTQRVAYAFFCGALLYAMLTTFASSDTVTDLNTVLSLGWLMVFVWLQRLSSSSVPSRHQAWSLAFAPLVMCGVGMGMVWLRESSGTGPWLLIYVLSIAWAADIGAYFIGKEYGRRKLSLVLSPGKSIEGALGGQLCVALLATVAAWLLSLDLMQSLLLILISMVSAVFSVGGDLFESALKRAAGVKDSGWILPGHGGVLDRVDSPLASVPVFVALSVFLPL